MVVAIVAVALVVTESTLFSISSCSGAFVFLLAALALDVILAMSNVEKEWKLPEDDVTWNALL
jgi:hypothetical protein